MLPCVKCCRPFKWQAKRSWAFILPIYTYRELEEMCGGNLGGGGGGLLQIEASETVYCIKLTCTPPEICLLPSCPIRIASRDALYDCR